MHSPLPPQLHVFVRDWLSANNILLKSRDGHVLIDSGYVTHAPLTLQLLTSERGLGAEPLAKLVNTHCHSDHIGGNAAVHAAYGCPIEVPEAEAPLIERWDTTALLLDYADQSADRFTVDAVLRSGRDARLGRPRVAAARRAGAPDGRARLLQRRAPRADFRRRAVGERLRLRDARVARPRRAARRRATRST